MSHSLSPVDINEACSLLLLGIAQDAGVPQAGCSCLNCAATWSGSMPRQFAVSAAIIDPQSRKCWLIDCSPDFRDQYHMLQEHLAQNGLRDVELCGVLLTHLHMGHYLGLMQFGREAMDWKGLQIWGTSTVLHFFSSNQPWRTYIDNGNFVLNEIHPEVAVQLSPQLTVTATSVPHRAEFSDAVGYFIKGPHKTAFYLPDIDSWDKWLAAGIDIKQVVQSVDIAFLDGCFYSAAELPGRDISQIPHPLMTDTAQRLRGTEHKQVVLIHMNHSNPVYRNGPERKDIEDQGLEVAHQGGLFSL